MIVADFVHGDVTSLAWQEFRSREYGTPTTGS